MSGLAQRVLTALVLAAILLPTLLLLPKIFGLVLLSVIVLAAVWEWSAFLQLPGWFGRAAYVALAALGLVLLDQAVAAGLPTAMVMVAALVGWAAAFVLVLRFPLPLPLGRALTAVAGLVALLPAWLAMATLWRSEPQGRELLLLSLLVVVAADVGAYFAGHALGRVKLAPRVSPGKTWEGLLGGLAAAALMTSAGALLLGQPVARAASLGLAVGAMSVVGDLTESMFKRSAGLKDSGSLLPGHGGVLDRVDSVAAAAPLFLLGAGWLGWLSP
jgi:phosphatidate cytidylyltransferase